jgi:uncharacterized protein DUF2568
MAAMTHLVIRFVLELAALVAAAIVGASIGTPPLGLVGGLGAVVLFVVVWGLWIAPRARFALPPMARHLIGTAIMVGVTIGLVLVGQPLVGEILVALILANATFLVIGGHVRSQGGHR